MEIPPKVQEKLKCSECDEFLSCGPVYLLHETGGTICGRCSEQPQGNESKKNRGRSRNESYEAAASLLGFPCAHAARGCPEKVPFSVGRPAHESSCKFRPFFCPIAPRESCEWIGTWPNLKQHCEEHHPENILQKPCILPRPDLTISNLQTFVISAFRFLFLLHVKVCVTSGKLFHSLRIFGDPESFSYSLEIEGNNRKNTETRSVLPAGILTLQEPSASYILINGLLGIFDGTYDESTFAITIQASPSFSCLNCSKNIVDKSDSEFCEKCQGQLKKCKFSKDGCLFVDVNKNKCEKHEKYFCKYQTKCFDCEVNFVAGSFIEHFSSSNSCRKTTKANNNSVVRVTPNTSSNWDYILFSSNNLGTIICAYKLSSTNIYLHLCTSLPTFELKNYKCSVELTDPQTEKTQTFTPQIGYSYFYDWEISEEINNCSCRKNIGSDMKIIISKNVD